MSSDYISRDEFQNLRDDIKEDFARTHSCDQRIEQKLDNLISRLDSNEEKKGDRKFKIKIAGITTVFALVSSVILHFLWG